MRTQIDDFRIDWAPLGAPIRPIAPGLAVPSRFTAEVHQAEAHVATMTVEVIDRVPRCAELTVHGHHKAVKVPVQAWVDQLVAAIAVNVDVHPNGTATAVPGADPEAVQQALDAPRRRRSETPEELAKVADVYNRRRSIRDVMAVCGMSQATAYRWRARAIEAGLIEEGD